jgi:energy-coupling factor transport system permease protein
MLGNIAIGQFIPGHSLAHRLDPRAKILIMLVFITALFLATSLSGWLILTAFIVVAVLASQVPTRILARSLRPVLFIIILTVALNLFMTRGVPLFRLGPLVATREGLAFGLLLGYRIVLLITFSSLLTLTTSPIALTDGIEALLKPFTRLGVPAHELAMMMSIALRFIPTLLEEADKIMKAQMARGADFESGSFMQRARSLVPLLVPLFVSAFRRADELAMAMEARCYRGGEGRTRMKQLKAETRDYLALGAVIVLAILVVVSRNFAF